MTCPPGGGSLNPVPTIGVVHRVLLLACLALLSQAALAQPTDADADGLNDAWEAQFGLSSASATGNDGAAGDPDGDGISNLDEQRAGSHPRGFHSRLFAEGATGAFFDVRFAVFNPDGVTAARVLARYFTTTGATQQQLFVLPPHGRVTIDPETIPGLQQTAFSTSFESDAPIVADRTMSWDGSHHSSHAETGTAWPSQTWFLAEGATHSGFELFYLLQNPSATPADVDVTYLLPSGNPIRRRYRVGGSSRFNIWVNREDTRLGATDVSAIVTSTVPIVVERAMYSREFAAGHASVGITSPATRWYLAEGATGGYFDFFILIANPNDAPSDVSVTYLLPDGSRVARTYQVPGKRRYTIWVDQEDARLANTAIASIVESTNGVPILVERAMWWPGPTAGSWQEAHNSAGLTATASRWALAEGEISAGADRVRTYTAIANTSPTGGTIRVTLHYEGGGAESRDFTVLPGRFNIDIAAAFAGAMGKRFGTIVESVGTPLALVVEQTSYSDANGVAWAAGTNAAGTPLGVAPGALSDAPVVTLTATDAFASEAGDAAQLTFTRTQTSGPLTVRLVSVGSASNADVTPAPQTVTFAAGSGTAVVDVRAVDDRAIEVDELLTIVVAAGDGYSVGRQASATVVVYDNDTDVSLNTPPTVETAVRFLNQATFGTTWADIAAVQSLGYRGWIEEQINAPISGFTSYVDATVAGTGETLAQSHLQEAWVQNATQGPDQLRQRVANALLEIIVVSTANGLGGSAQTIGLAGYMDVLMRNAFGSFRTLLQEVTLHPAMGRYLNMVNNARENERTGQNPNENYAREILQLFSIGLVRLNLDGTPMLGSDGQPIPTYDQSVIQGFAKVFTGWTYGQTTQPYRVTGTQNWRMPMVPVASQHSTAQKTLLDGKALPAGGTPEQDLTAALDNIFGHPNVGPFIGERLIQRLVTSNPSPQYVERVAAVFNDNGHGIRGDLAAVVRAILLDPEARSAAAAQTPGYGHLREPMIRVVAALRGFNGRAASGRYRAVTNLDGSMGQAPFRSPTVFNFFLPDYVKPGDVAEAGLVSPEFQIATETTVVNATNTMRDLVYRGYGGSDANLVRLDLSAEEALASNPAALMDRLNALLFGGQMSQATRDIVLHAVNAVSASQPLTRARMAIHLLLSSPEYLIQK
jgi:uncharacterized protein (DUF1800 family)